jgi:hypothetical protein
MLSLPHQQVLDFLTADCTVEVCGVENAVYPFG